MLCDAAVGVQLSGHTQVGSAAFTPTALSVNGLGAKDLLHTAFEVILHPAHRSIQPAYLVTTRCAGFKRALVSGVRRLRAALDCRPSRRARNTACWRFPHIFRSRPNRLAQYRVHSAERHRLRWYDATHLVERGYGFKRIYAHSARDADAAFRPWGDV